MKNTKVVFTDIDGTLLDGFITIDLVNYLFSKGLFDSAEYQKQLDLMKLFKTGKITMLDWLKKWASIWGNGIKNKRKTDLEFECKKFFSTYDKIYPSSKKLIDFFHKKGYLVVGVSVGVIEADNLIKKKLGLDDIISSKVRVKNGIYTGEVITKLHNKYGKQNAVLDYVKKNKIDLTLCVGIGDSLHDVQFIDLMVTKIALNADSDFLSYANKEGYHSFDYLNVLNNLEKINLI